MKLNQIIIKLLMILIPLVLMYYLFVLFRPEIIIQNNTQVPIYLSTSQSQLGKEADVEDLQTWKERYKILPSESKKIPLSFSLLLKNQDIDMTNSIRIGQQHERTTEFNLNVKTNQEGACQITMMVNSDSISLKEESGYFCHKKLIPVIR